MSLLFDSLIWQRESFKWRGIRTLKVESRSHTSIIELAHLAAVKLSHKNKHADILDSATLFLAMDK